MTNIFKAHWRFILAALGALIVLNATLIGIFKMPAFFEVFELNKDSDNNLSTSINNFISPILNFITVILVYAAYVKQVEANSNAQENNNIQYCLMLFDSLNKEIENVYLSTNNYRTKESKVVTGSIALMELCNKYAEGKFKHKCFYNKNYGRMIMSVYYSFKAIELWIDNTIQKDENKRFLQARLFNFYNSRLAIHFYRLKVAFQEYPTLKDEYATLIIKLVDEYDDEEPNYKFKDLKSF